MVSALEGAGRDIVSQLVRTVPMTQKRKKRANEIRFHEFDRFNRELADIFDINVSQNFSDEEKSFISRMFLRRHVYEHLGGIVDERYVQKSADSNVRVGQLLRDSKVNTLRFADKIIEIMVRLQEGFHEILPVNGTAIQILAPKKVKRQV
ncbi:MAG: hypothetical protein ACFE0S_03250 [Rhodospirillales bacterium]